MADDREAPGILIPISDAQPPVASIGPLHVDPDAPWRGPDGAHDFILGPTTVVTKDGTRIVRDSGNGFDAIRFAYFRDDLRTLQRERVGSIRLGDHDYYEVLELIADGDRVQVQFNHASLDIWDIEITTISWERIATIIEQIDDLERAFGPLTGSCGACGTPRPQYDPSRVATHEFLVTCDDGTEGLWGVVFARREQLITAQYPELTVVHARPEWMDDARYAALRSEGVHLDAGEPKGILNAVVAERR